MIVLNVMVILMAALTVNASEQEQNIDSLQIETTSLDTIADVAEITGAVDQSSFDYVQRDVDHKRQVWLGMGMMAFVALIISSAQSWNPR